MLSVSGVNDQQKQANDDTLRAKDELIKELRSRIRFLEDQNALLMKKLKVV
jgi:hypothetical protein